MRGLAFIKNQLNGVVDWDRHGDLMDDLDAEVADLHNRIALVLQLHSQTVALDALCVEGYEAGKVFLSAEMAEMWAVILSCFERAATELLADAEGFKIKGIRVADLPSLRRIAQDPGIGMFLPEVIKTARQIDAGNGLPPREVEIPASTFQAIDQKKLVG